MAEELQSLIEKINRDGVEKANAEAERIVAAAKEEAAKIVKAAKAEADKYEAAAKTEAQAAAARAEETLRQASRDAVISVEGAVQRLLEKILSTNVNTALADPSAAAAIVGDAIREMTSGGEISVGAKIAESVRAQLAAKPEFTVVLDETLDSGFRVKQDAGRVEHDFTSATVAAELAKRLRPDLAKLMRENTGAK